MNKFIQIDEDGYFMVDGLRVADANFGHHLLSHLRTDEKYGLSTDADGTRAIVEAFDEPLVARQVFHIDSHWEIESPYEVRWVFDPRTLSLDDWDRFHGLTKSGLPFVLSRPAQAEFFNLCDSFEDDSVTLDAQKIPIPPWLLPRQEVSQSQFWTDIYREEVKPGFDLQKPAPGLVDTLNKIKIPKSRVLVLGAGPCNDAAYFAQQGHLVTAVDFSEEAFSRARAQFGNLPNLQMVVADAFHLPGHFQQSFDLVFEHTCYCAIDPSMRGELVKVWRKVLVDRGHLLGIFFAMSKREGPPYGGSEWEVRERLKKGFDFLYWQRLRNSVEGRLGREFVVYAQKK